jgi:hypothetical protein
VRALRKRVVKKLRDLGYSVETREIYPALGAWRHPQHDVYRWTAMAVAPNGGRIELCSWYTLTQCAAASAILDVDDDGQVCVSTSETKEEP